MDRVRRKPNGKRLLAPLLGAASLVLCLTWPRRLASAPALTAGAEAPHQLHAEPTLRTPQAVDRAASRTSTQARITQPGKPRTNQTSSPTDPTARVLNPPGAPPEPTLLILPRANLFERTLRAHLSATDADKKLHLHYPGYLLPEQREPFYVRVPKPQGEAAGQPLPIPKVVVLDSEGNVHPRLWASFFGHGRLMRNGDLHAPGPLVAHCPEGASEYAFLLRGPHTPWDEERAWVQASSATASAKMEAILSPALDREWMIFPSERYRSASCVLVLPMEVQPGDASVELWSSGSKLEVSSTSTDQTIHAATFPIYPRPRGRTWRILRWTWRDIPWPAIQPHARIQVHFPSGLHYDHTLIPQGR